MIPISKQTFFCIKQPKYGYVIYFHYQGDMNKDEIASELQRTLGVKVDYETLEVDKYYRIGAGEITPKQVGLRNLVHFFLQENLLQEYEVLNMPTRLNSAEATEFMKQGYTLVNREGDFFFLSNNEIKMLSWGTNTTISLEQLPIGFYLLFDKCRKMHCRRKEQVKASVQKDNVKIPRVMASGANNETRLYSLAAVGIAVLLTGYLFYQFK